MQTEDGSIIQECLNGESEAFGVLVDKYREGIYAFIYAKLRNFQDAQDVTQEVFLQAYRGLRNLRRRESFAFWLYRIAYARCVDLIRSRSRRVDQSFIADQDPKIIDAPSLEFYRSNQLSESVREALEVLPETYSEVLILHYLGGMTIKEIARAIGASPTAVGVRLSRARAQLKKEMVAMMDAAFEGQGLPVGFTFRVVEAIKRIKINPMPRVAGLPWGLSLAAGIIVTVLSLNPHMSMTSDIAMPAGSPLLVEAKALKTGEIPVDMLKTSEISIMASKQEDDNNNPANPQNTFFAAPRADDGGWARKADMPAGARSALSTSVVDGIIYAIGGGLRPGGPCYKTVEAYDPAKDTWTRKADMPTARGSFSTSVVDGIIYAIGGTFDSEVPFSTVEAYDPGTDTWMTKADMPTARWWLSTSVVDGIIYAFGGWERGVAGAELSTVEAYDPETDTWTIKEDMPNPRAGLSTSVVDGIIYAIGGAADGSDLSIVEAYDPETDTWMEKEDMPTIKKWVSTSVANKMIYTFGGWIGDQNGVSLPDLEVYDPATDTWTIKEDMPVAKCGLSTSVVNGRIYAIGGWTNAATALVEEYDPGSIAVEYANKQPTKWGEVKTE